MAQDIVVRMQDRDGDNTTTRRTVITSADDAVSVTHQSLPLAAATRTEIDLGGVVTASTIYVETLTGNGTIQVFRNRSPESWTMDNLFFVLGATVTNLALQASEASTVWVYVGGASS